MFRGNMMAALFPSVSSELRGLDPNLTPREAVFQWLTVHKTELIRAEHMYQVDRRAIAAVIMYEALRNVRPTYLMMFDRGTGAGKVHFKDYRFREGTPVAKEAEQLGLLPPATVEQRRARLQSPSWSILYIAAIMRAEIEAIPRCPIGSLNCKVGALTTFYTGWDVGELKIYFAGMHPHAVQLNEPGRWAQRQRDELTRYLGKPSNDLCKALIWNNRNVLAWFARSRAVYNTAHE